MYSSLILKGFFNKFEEILVATHNALELKDIHIFMVSGRLPANQPFFAKNCVF
jgi:hypothetical protein